MDGPADRGHAGDDARWRDLERRVAALERTTADQRSAAPAAQGQPEAPQPVVDAERFWALTELRRQSGELGLAGGAVLFTGTATLPGGTAEWQEGRAVDDLIDDASLDALDSPAAALAALGSPVRLLLLLRVLRSASGTASAAELTADEALGTSGQVYHHLRHLVAAGWLRTAARGRYAVPTERVVPLLVALALAGR